MLISVHLPCTDIVNIIFVDIFDGGVIRRPSFFGGFMSKTILIMLGTGVIFLFVIILIAVLDLSTRKLHK